MKRKNNKNKKERQKISRIISNNIYMIKLVAKSIPSFVPIITLYGIIFGALNSLINVALVKMLLNDVEAGKPFLYIATVIMGTLIASIVMHAIRSWYNCYLHPRLHHKLHGVMQMSLFEKVRTVELACYDNPQFYNDFIMVLNDADGRAASVVESVKELLYSLSSAATVIVILAGIDPLLLVMTVAMVAMSMIIDFKDNKYSYSKTQELLPSDRRSDYVSRVFSMPDHAKELRLSNADELLNKDFDAATEESANITAKYGKKFFLLNISWSTIYFLFENFALTAYLTYKLMVQKTIHLGDFGASINALWNLYNNMYNMINKTAEFQKNSLYIEKFRQFMDYSPKMKNGSKHVPQINNISFENVSFRYNADSDYTLENVNFTLHRGERIAIVGYNGAGKSTLIKLLLRFYDPDEGTVKLNGIDIKEFDITEYRSKIGAVFQDFKIFAATVAENVAMSEYTEDMKERVTDALKKSTFCERLSSLENGIYTDLTTEYSNDGVNLSGGEAQKVAIARVFEKNYDMIVMDEPSSALDPMSEYELNKTIMEQTEDKLTVFISHRLSTTRMADKIYMFAHGKIIESGSHDELMANEGKYAEMFLIQAEKYNKKTV